jgi:hypothetical protein
MLRTIYRIAVAYLVSVAVVYGGVPFSFWKKAAGGGSPTFVGEIQRATATSSTSLVVTLTGGIVSGHRIVIVAGMSGNQVSTVTDGVNTYAIDASAGNDGTSSLGVAVVSAPVTTTLNIGDSITINFVGGGFGAKSAVIYDISGVTAVDVIKARSVFGATVNESNTTTAAAVILGAVGADNGALTYTGGSWTTLGAQISIGSYAQAILTTTLGSGGTQNPNGTWTTNNGQANAWVAYK